MPGFFRTWSRVAWGDLLASLPEECDAIMEDGAAPQEEFQQQVREAMLIPLLLYEEKNNEYGLSSQKRPLAHWCRMFAKLGPWKSIRDLACWTRFIVNDGGELLLQIAIRHELFSQIGSGARLRILRPNRFSRLAAKYHVGQSSRDERPHGQSAVVLDVVFVRELIADLLD